MTSFESYCRSFEYQPQIDQLSSISTFPMEIIFETLETDDNYMNPSHSIIGTIISRKSGNTFQHQNVPNQRQHTNKTFHQKYQHSTTRQHYQQRNTVQNNQRRNPNQQYQPRSFQRPRITSIP